MAESKKKRVDMYYRDLGGGRWGVYSDEWCLECDLLCVVEGLSDLGEVVAEAKRVVWGECGGGGD